MIQDDIFQKARELGDLIAQSEAFLVMQEKEAQAANDKVLEDFFNLYSEKRKELEELTMNAEPDYERIGELSHEVERIQLDLNKLPKMQELQKARESFSQMMDRVNRILQYALVGEEAPEESACSGSCSSCHGCH